MHDIETLVTSQLSGKVSRDGMTIEVIIYLDDDYWRIAFVDHEGLPASWPCSFNSDCDALNEVLRSIERDGIVNFLTETTLH